MAETDGFDREFGRIEGIFGDMRQTLQQALKMLAETADTSMLPQADKLAAEEARLAAEIPDRRVAETALARLVLSLAKAIAFRKVEFDSREQPTRGEKLLGYLSKSAMRRRIEARSKNPETLRYLEKLLARGDALAGLLEAERNALLDERKAGEGDLGTFVDHRSEMTEALRGESSEIMTGVEAVAKMDRAVSVFDRFVGELNLRVGACNVLRHKLVTDIEDLLILYQVAFDTSRPEGRALFEQGRFPNLSMEIEPFLKGLLTIRGLSGRRERADRAFLEFFPVLAGGEAPAEPKGGDQHLERAVGLKLPQP